MPKPEFLDLSNISIWSQIILVVLGSIDYWGKQNSKDGPPCLRPPLVQSKTNLNTMK